MKRALLALALLLTACGSSSEPSADPFTMIDAPPATSSPVPAPSSSSSPRRPSIAQTIVGAGPSTIDASDVDAGPPGAYIDPCLPEGACVAPYMCMWAGDTQDGVPFDRCTSACTVDSDCPFSPGITCHPTLHVCALAGSR